MSDAVIISVVTGIFSLVTAALTSYMTYRLGKIHKQFNSRMDELVTAKEEAGHAKGVLEGHEQAAEESKK